MVGATDEAFELVKAPFKQWASLVVHAGEPGAGTRMKLARNMLTLHRLTPRRAKRRSWPKRPGINLQDLGKVVRHTDTADRRRRARSCSATT